MFERPNQENICNRYDAGFYVNPTWILASKGRDEHLHQEKNQARDQDTWYSTGDPSADGPPPHQWWRKHSATYQPGRNRHLWPATSRRPRPSVGRHLSFCSGSSLIPPSCGCPASLSRPHSQGRNATPWGLASGSCLVALRRSPSEAADRPDRAPALRGLRAASCPISWGDPSTPVLTGFDCSVVSDYLLLHFTSPWIKWKTSCSRDDFKRSVAELLTQTFSNEQHSLICNVYDNGLLSFLYKKCLQINEGNKSKGGQMTASKQVSPNMKTSPHRK